MPSSGKKKSDEKKIETPDDLADLIDGKARFALDIVRIIVFIVCEGLQFDTP
jgi:hypothetical protein